VTRFAFTAAALATAASLGLSPTGAAAQAGPADRDATTWGVGLALSPDFRPYRDFDEKTKVWPLIAFENRWLRVAGPGLEFKLGQAGPVALGLTVSYAGDGYDAGDSPVFAGMAKRHASVWVGGRAGARTGLGLVSAEWSADAAGRSKGQKLKFGWQQRVALGDWALTPRATATWHDQRFVRYYYGVEAGEVRAGRAPYRPGDEWTAELGARTDYRVTPQHSLFADLGLVAYGDRFAASPLVDRRTVPSVRVGWLYRF
jgi:outer membrane protein